MYDTGETTSTTRSMGLVSEAQNTEYVVALKGREKNERDRSWSNGSKSSSISNDIQYSPTSTNAPMRYIIVVLQVLATSMYREASCHGG